VVRQGMIHLWVVLGLVLMIGSGVVATPPRPAGVVAEIPLATPIRSPAPSDSLLYAAISPAYRDDVMATTGNRLSRYTIAASLHGSGSPLGGGPGATLENELPASNHGSIIATPLAVTGATPIVPSHPAGTITGTEEVRFVNDTGATLNELYFRLSPNLRQYAGGGMVIHDVTLDGMAIPVEPPPLYANPAATPVTTPDAGSRDLLLIRLPLREPLPAQGTVTVRLTFSTTVPLRTDEGPGEFSFDPDADSWALAYWFPILAGFDPSSGWEIDPPAAWSDPTFSNTALFDVTLTAPDDLVLVTPGIAVEVGSQGDEQIRRFISGPVRDFPIVADPNFASVTSDVAGTMVTSYFRPEDAAGGAQILEWATQALATFTDLFGPYPYTSLDVVTVPNVPGLEFPQMIAIDATFYANPMTAGSRPGAIEFLVAHEIAHQWWYGLVGSNPYRHAYVDEGLAEYSAVLYFEYRYGVEAAEEQLDAGLRLRYATMLLTDEDRVVDQPTVDFPDLVSYFTTVYRKGGLGFAALRQEIGDDAFFAGLRTYAGSMRFEVAGPDDLRSAFEDASGSDLSDFWRVWFETTSGRVEIIVGPTDGTPTVSAPEANPVAGAGSFH